MNFEYQMTLELSTLAIVQWTDFLPYMLLTQPSSGIRYDPQTCQEWSLNAEPRVCLENTGYDLKQTK